MSKYDKSAASYKELVEYWNNLFEGKYYIESDYSEDKNNNYIGLCKINERRTKNKFMVENVPEPFFGNIKNPKIILLALNPSYDSNGDKLDLEVFKKANIDISFSDFLPQKKVYKTVKISLETPSTPKIAQKQDAAPPLTEQIEKAQTPPATSSSKSTSASAKKQSNQSTQQKKSSVPATSAKSAPQKLQKSVDEL